MQKEKIIKLKSYRKKVGNLFAIDFENSLCALAALLDAIKAPLLMFETDGM